MDNKYIVKGKTYFDIPPKLDKTQSKYIYQERVVFMSVGFDLDYVVKIGEPVHVRDLHYQFSIWLTSTKEDNVVTFDFARKADCIAAQRELCRAWCAVGEFAKPEEKDQE